MSNVFKKLLRKEFGKTKYESFSQTVRENLRFQKNDSTELYAALYEELRGRDKDALTRMNERLNDSMLLAFRISRSYGFTFAIYLISFFTLAFAVRPEIAGPAILFISVLIMLKTYEYIANRFSHIDMYIILIYKAVLERLMVDAEGD